MTDGMRVNVQGLREFRTAIRRVGPDMPKALQQENKAVAGEVAGQARAAYVSVYTSRSGRGAGSIRGLATQTRAQVAIGGARTPYMLGLEFGSNRFPQFRPWSGPAPRGRGSRGKFLYPALRAALPGLVQRYAQAIDKVAARAFGGSTA